MLPNSGARPGGDNLEELTLVRVILIREERRAAWMRVDDGGEETFVLGSFEEAHEPLRGPRDVNRRGRDAVLGRHGNYFTRHKAPTRGPRPRSTATLTAARRT